MINPNSLLTKHINKIESLNSEKPMNPCYESPKFMVDHFPGATVTKIPNSSTSFVFSGTPEIALNFIHTSLNDISILGIKQIKSLLPLKTYPIYSWKIYSDHSNKFDKIIIKNFKRDSTLVAMNLENHNYGPQNFGIKVEHIKNQLIIKNWKGVSSNFMFREAILR